MKNLIIDDDIISLHELYSYRGDEYLSCIISYCPACVSDYALDILCPMIDYEAIEAIHCGISNVNTNDNTYISQSLVFNSICQYIIYNYS